MSKYIHIITYLLTHDITFLKKCWEVEFIKKKFTWKKLFKYLRKREDTYLAWWRLAHEMAKYGNKKQIKIAHKINQKLIKDYSIDIGIGNNTFIDVGITMFHGFSIVIYDNVKIGKNFTIRQSTTIGGKDSNTSFVIGDNVDIGVHSLILGGNLKIGNNVKIGAMSFINNDIPDNCTVYTEKRNIIKTSN